MIKKIPNTRNEVGARVAVKKSRAAAAPAETALTLKFDALHRWRYDNIGRLLLVAFAHWESRLLESLRAGGFTTLKLVHLTCLRYLDLDGTRIAELARRANLTKAGMGQIVTQCERLGFVTVTADAQDARAKLVQFTKAGWSVIDANRLVIEATEAELKSRMGSKVFDQVYGGLAKLRDSLDPAESGAVRRTMPTSNSNRTTRRVRKSP
jgi:DNA-binding MarR family transcriptional regulator